MYNTTKDLAIDFALSYDLFAQLDVSLSLTIGRFYSQPLLSKSGCFWCGQHLSGTPLRKLKLGNQGFETRLFCCKVAEPIRTKMLLHFLSKRDIAIY